MSRLARVIVPGFPHHVTQRGNRRAPVFFEQSDYALYRDLLAERCRKASVACWAYCLMPNHMHLILVPETADGLARALGETHRQYTGYINARARWTGHLFQGRFASVVLDDDHLMAAARYVALNPVRARLVTRPQDWAWSSVRAHLRRRHGRSAARAARPHRSVARHRTGGCRACALARGRDTGRPLGTEDFVARLEALMRRTLRPQKPGRKAAKADADTRGDLFAGTGE